VSQIEAIYLAYYSLPLLAVVVALGLLVAARRP
jgi:hypothetical protein